MWQKRPPLSKANSSASNASGGGKPGGGLSKDGSSANLAGTGKAGSAADSVVTALTSRMESLTSMAAHDLDRSITKKGNNPPRPRPSGLSKQGSARLAYASCCYPLTHVAHDVL
jgi:hypothetical protein